MPIIFDNNFFSGRILGKEDWKELHKVNYSNPVLKAESSLTKLSQLNACLTDI